MLRGCLVYVICNSSSFHSFIFKLCIMIVHSLNMYTLYLYTFDKIFLSVKLQNCLVTYCRLHCVIWCNLISYLFTHLYAPATQVQSRVWSRCFWPASMREFFAISCTVFSLYFNSATYLFVESSDSPRRGGLRGWI